MKPKSKAEWTNCSSLEAASSIPASGIDREMDVLLRDGRVAEVAAPGKLAGLGRKKCCNAKGCIVAPGFIDLHVHLREPGQPHKETIATGTARQRPAGSLPSAPCPTRIR